RVMKAATLAAKLERGVRRALRGNRARKGGWSMRPALALLVLPALVSGAYAADIKGTSRIDAVIVFPSGAELTRLGKVRLEAGDHVVLFADLPARAIASSIRVEGKATGKLDIGSVDSRRMFVPRTDDAVAA